MAKLLIMIGLVLFNANNSFAEENHWQKIDKGIYEASLSSIAIIPSGKLFTSTDRVIYVSNDNAKTWQRLAFLPKSSTRINDIVCVDGDYLRIYIATTDGLYEIIEGANRAERIFKAWRKSRKDIRGIKSNPVKKGKLYIGTGAGLFISNDNGRHWKPIAYFKNKEINDIAILNRDIFVAASDGVYKGNTFSDNWSRTFVVSVESKPGNNDIENNSNENKTIKYVINCLTANINKKDIYAGTNKGILASYDNGKTWQSLTDSGLINDDIEDILVYKSDIIAATKKGAFYLAKTETGWRSVSDGGMAYHTKKLAYDKNSNYIYAATSNGLYRYIFVKNEKQKQDQKNNYADFIKRQIETEPGIQQIQEVAVEYAEVSPYKIEWMREAAKNKAWLPKLTMGFDYDSDNNISIDRGGTKDTDVFIIGPDNESWEWGISASWDLGELIWNDDQANIDVRSKLMVQLRDDILTEVINLYFERRRLQLDIINNKYSENIIKAKLLRLQELTARIDALTGGFLSRNGASHNFKKYGGLYEKISKK